MSDDNTKCDYDADARKLIDDCRDAGGSAGTLVPIPFERLYQTIVGLLVLVDAAEARGREQAKAEVVRDLRMTFAQNRNAQELADYIERGDHVPPAVEPSRPARTPEQVRELMADVTLPRVLASDEPPGGYDE